MAVKVNLGAMVYTVDLLEWVPDRNAVGEDVGTWEVVASVFASLDPVRGYEQFRAARTVSEELVRFVIHYRTDVTPRNRVRYDSGDYDIREIVNVNDLNRFLAITAAKVV